MYKRKPNRNKRKVSKGRTVMRSAVSGRYVAIRQAAKANSGGVWTMKTAHGVMRGRRRISLHADTSALPAENHSPAPKGQEKPWPSYPLFDSGDPTFAERVDEELVGFGGS